MQHRIVFERANLTMPRVGERMDDTLTRLDFHQASKLADACKQLYDED